MSNDKIFMNNALEVTIRIGSLALLAAWCFAIVKPFIIPLAWGVIIAVAEYPVYVRLRRWLGGRAMLAATFMIFLGLVLLIVPTVLLSSTVVDSAQDLARGLHQGTIAVPPPPAYVKDWPLIGTKLSEFWHQASENLAGSLALVAPHMKAVGAWLLSTAAGAGFGILQFVLAVVVAGFILARAEGSTWAANTFARRLAGEKGAEFARLAGATVQSVTRGILGVALIQALLAGLGFLAMGIPGAGLWALVCLILSVVQIGIVPVTLPIVIYVFSTADPVSAVIFTVWSIFVGLLDNILKPILLGRGVDVPMAVIFVGAIGGFISAGIIGLFVGAVVLVLGYRLFLAWLKAPEDEQASKIGQKI